MKKNFRVLALALCTVFAMVACNNQPAEEPVDTTPVAEEVVEAEPVEEVVAEAVVEDKKPAAKKVEATVKKSDEKTVTVTATVPAVKEQKKDAAIEAKAGNLTVSSDKNATTVSVQPTGKKSAAEAFGKKKN